MALPLENPNCRIIMSRGLGERPGRTNRIARERGPLRLHWLRCRILLCRRWRSWRRRPGMGRASAASLALHLAVVLLLILGRSWMEWTPPPLDMPVPVELVDPGMRTVPSAGVADSGRLLEKPPETRLQPPAAAPPPTPEPARPAAPRPRPAAAPHAKPPPPDDFTRMLDSLRPQASRQALRHAGPSSDGGAADREDSPGRRGQVSVKDFLRAQIERHWELEIGALGDARLVISLRVVLLPDGSVSRAEVVDDPRYSSAPQYRSIAQSLRRAALVASPLRLPAGISGDQYRDMVLSFDPRKAVQ